MTVSGRTATVAYVRRTDQFAGGYEIRFVNFDTEEPEPLTLLVHEVELRKLVADIQRLLDGRAEEAGAEGVYIVWGGSPTRKS